MTDNVAVTPGSGATIATDDVGGVQYQVVKLDVGGDGASTPVSGTLPVSGTVTVTDGSGSLTVDGTVAVSNATFPVTDNAGSLTVDSLQLPSALGQTTMAASLAVALASNQSALPITDNSGSLTIDTAAKCAYAAAAAYTITLAALATDANLAVGREGTAVSFATANAAEVFIEGKVTTGTTPTASRQIQIWFAASHDGTKYAGNAAGTDGALTPTDKTQMRLLANIFTDNTSDKTYNFAGEGLRRLYGYVPKTGTVWVTHNTGVNLNATGSNQAIQYSIVTESLS